ncbi:MAG: LysR family transcriptional regulator [Sandaracinus sp.]|nr:LysR family transcriptional regulator [Sandaracinus sp.]MCB9637218.1 LysR family transcriptional regulator [Sandaracinus sp.]
MEPHLASLDLNLLVALDALLQEGSVTRAARRLGLSQPATSHALARLRELFGDPLLVRVGRGLAPTPRAEALRAPLERVLADVRRLLRERPAFDPATSRRRFVLLCPDLLAPLLPELLTVLEHDAPGVDLAVEQPRGDIHGPLEEGRADVALGPTRWGRTGLLRRGLGTLRWCVVGRRDHPAWRGRWTTAKWLAHPHVEVRTGNPDPNMIGEALAAAGLERRVGLTVPGFLAALVAVSKSRLFFCAPRELATPLAEPLGLTLRPLPIEAPPIPVALFCSERVAHEPGTAWLREKVAEVVGEALKKPR